MEECPLDIIKELRYVGEASLIIHVLSYNLINLVSPINIININSVITLTVLTVIPQICYDAIVGNISVANFSK